MSYSDKKWTRIQSGANQDMGNATPTVFSFKGPTGKKGTIVDVGIEVTETFACDSTEASFQVGTTGDANAYCQLNITDGTLLTDTFNIQDDTNAIIDEALPADTQIECTPVVGVDAGTEAGGGYPYIVVAWY